MSEVVVSIPAGEISLHGRYEKGRKTEGFLLCHPHPLYGGDMHSNVVVVLQRVLSERGWGTLRFDFRGAGGSEGRYSEGLSGAEDVRSAAVFLEKEGHRAVHAAGYSFGAWAVLKAVSLGLRPASLILVAPPLDFMSFAGLRLSEFCPTLIILGSQDGYCRRESLENWLSKGGASSYDTRVRFLPGCDHFFWGHEDRLAEALGELMDEAFAEST